MTLSKTSGNILRIQLNRPAKKNAITSSNLLGQPFGALRTADLGSVTSVYLDCEHVAFRRTKNRSQLATVKHQTALTAAPLMNARMSALITSAFVVIIPC